jgi:rubrerythrin
MVQHDPIVSTGLIVRLYSVARGLEDEGQNNIAKLFRAAALGEMYRASQGRPRLGEGLEEEAKDVVTDLVSQDTTTESLAVALFRGLEALDNGAWPMMSEIPRTYVCRFCGAVVVGHMPDRCPQCAARRLTFQESLPVFYLEPITPDDLQTTLCTNLEEVVRSVDGISEDAADQGVWPMRDMLSHLHGAQLLFFSRSKRMLEEEEPDLGTVAPTDVRAKSDSGAPTMAEMLQNFKDTRNELIKWVNQRADEELNRSGYHGEWGRLTILSQLTYLVRHEQSHLAELEARRQGR